MYATSGGSDHISIVFSLHVANKPDYISTEKVNWSRFKHDDIISYAGEINWEYSTATDKLSSEDMWKELNLKLKNISDKAPIVSTKVTRDGSIKTKSPSACFAHGQPTSIIINSLQSNASSTPVPSSTCSTDPETDYANPTEPGELDTYSSILMLNIQSINPSARSSSMWKIPYLANEVQNRAASNCIPFIALTETWLKPCVQNAQLHIDNYNIFRCDRSTRVGGGVLLYAHQDLPITNVVMYDDKVCQLLMCTCESSKMIMCHVSPSQCTC